MLGGGGGTCRRSNPAQLPGSLQSTTRQSIKNGRLSPQRPHRRRLLFGKFKLYRIASNVKKLYHFLYVVHIKGVLSGRERERVPFQHYGMARCVLQQENISNDFYPWLQGCLHKALCGNRAPSSERASENYPPRSDCSSTTAHDCNSTRHNRCVQHAAVCNAPFL